jgi:hypothetical protein
MAGAGLGFVTTTAFGLLLAATARGRRIEDVSFWRATTMSGVLGALVPLALAALGGGAVPSRLLGAPAVLICALFAAALGGGLVAIGKEARLRELEKENAEAKLLEK